MINTPNYAAPRPAYKPIQDVLDWYKSEQQLPLTRWSKRWKELHPGQPSRHEEVIAGLEARLAAGETHVLTKDSHPGVFVVEPEEWERGLPAQGVGTSASSGSPLPRPEPNIQREAGIMAPTQTTRQTSHWTDLGEAGPPGSGSVSCPYCTATFNSQSELDSHMAAYHPEVPWVPGSSGAATGSGDVDDPVIGPIGGQGDTIPFPVAPPYAYDNRPSPGSPGYAPWIEEERQDPRAGYMAGLGLYGKGYLRPYEQYQAGMYEPMNFLWNTHAQMEALNRPGYDAPDYLSQFAPQYGQNPFSMHTMANRTLGDIMGMSEADRAGMTGGTFETGLGQMMGYGLRQGLGPAASWLQSRIPMEQEMWQSKYPQQQGPSFLDYVNQKYNLSRYF